MEKKIITPVVGGILLGLISVILFLAYYFSGILFDSTNPLRWVPSLVQIILLVILVIKWANDKLNEVSFGNCFGYGFKMVAMSAIISFFFMLVFILITPDFKAQFLESSRQQMEKNAGNVQLTDEQKTQGIALMNKMFMIIMLGGSLIGNLFLGALGSLLGAAFAKKNSKTPFENPVV